MYVGFYITENHWFKLTQTHSAHLYKSNCNRPNALLSFTFISMECTLYTTQFKVNDMRNFPSKQIIESIVDARIRVCACVWNECDKKATHVSIGFTKSHLKDSTNMNRTHLLPDENSPIYSFHFILIPLPSNKLLNYILCVVNLSARSFHSLNKMVSFATRLHFSLLFPF